MYCKQTIFIIFWNNILKGKSKIYINTVFSRRTLKPDYYEINNYPCFCIHYSIILVKSLQKRLLLRGKFDKKISIFLNSTFILLSIYDIINAIIRKVLK